MKGHYTLENFKTVLRNPELMGREALRLASWPIHQAYGKYTGTQYDDDSIGVMRADWDNFTILDAARFD